jgi:beta-galactosidase/beta-glucuronidase
MLRATTQDGSYPRPMMCRQQWFSLDGTWEFAHDDADEGLSRRWFAPDVGDVFTQRIEVPFPPESKASGLGATSFHPVVWYRRSVSLTELAPMGLDERRVQVHFGAVDYRASVWCDGQLVATHGGGQSPFTADLTQALDPDRDEHVLVVRAEDDPTDPDQARGKQDWRERTRGIWYERTTGIWQPVWAECVPEVHVAELRWTPELPSGVRGEVTLSRVPSSGAVIDVRISLGEEVLAEQTSRVQHPITTLDLAIAALRHGQDRARLLWSPEQPTLLDVQVTLRDASSGELIDQVSSYTGLRTVSVGEGVFRLNDQPYFMRSVLDQGYRTETHLASRGSQELRREVETIKALGFNTVRIHQKCEDPRWLHWADRLGLLVWAESASGYGFSASAVQRFVPEWMDIVQRDRSHPCVVAWVPVNESWGVQDIATSAAQQSYSRALAELTRSIDPSRPVLSNEGWEHVDSDILGLHDYSDAQEMRQRYADRSSVEDVVLRARTPHGRRPIISEEQERAFRTGETPVMITEFGGISLVAEGERVDAWGYSNAGSVSEYADLLRAQFDSLRASSEIAGFCYTQFMDTGQETNGLLFADGTPKLPVETIREIVTGESSVPRTPATSTVGWVEQ